MRPLCYNSQSASNESIQQRPELNRDKATGLREQGTRAHLTQLGGGKCFPKRQERGLTLIELLFTLLILSISFGLAIPQLREMVDASTISLSWGIARPKLIDRIKSVKSSSMRVSPRSCLFGKHLPPPSWVR